MRVAFDARGYSIASGGTYVYLSSLAAAATALGVTMTPLFDRLEARGLTRRLGPAALMAWWRGHRARATAYREALTPQTADAFCTVHPNYFPYRGVPRVLHVQDLAFLHTDYYHPAKRKYWQRAVARALRDYEGLLAISAYTRDDLARTFDIDRDRVTIVHHGLDGAFLGRPLKSWRPEAPLDLLCVGVHHPRKRVPEAVGFVAELRRAGLDARLTVVGPFSADTDRVRRAIAEHGLADHVTLTGPVDQHTLLDNYERADALLWTSAYEGFGLPLIEAMAMSVPIVAVNNSTVPELTEGHFVEIDVDDLAASARHARAALDDGEAINRRVAAAHGRAQGFTWPAAAQHSIDVWRQASHAR